MIGSVMEREKKLLEEWLKRKEVDRDGAEESKA